MLYKLKPEERAFEIATLSETIAVGRHRAINQKYGPSDRDFVEAHLEPVVGLVRRAGYGPITQAIAWLHDTGEDTGYTPEQMYEDGLPEIVVYPVTLLTKQPGENYEHYRKRCLLDERAKVVKFFDSIVNMGNTALNGEELTDERFAKNIARYPENIAMLQPLILPPEHPVFAEG
jgi:(p)ppGpp synthase/HD superfamily hydrolase